mmetsp:Transcript_26297/g.43065  ORF Transcript_26297/g.43065 Transcript_26297/m.43065 type:complete len:222 (+) Transcript_26297:900-1565(+)
MYTPSDVPVRLIAATTFCTPSLLQAGSFAVAEGARGIGTLGYSNGETWLCTGLVSETWAGGFAVRVSFPIEPELRSSGALAIGPRCALVPMYLHPAGNTFGLAALISGPTLVWGTAARFADCIGPAPMAIGPAPLTIGPASLAIGPTPLTIGPTPVAIGPAPLAINPHRWQSDPHPWQSDLHPWQPEPHNWQWSPHPWHSDPHRWQLQSNPQSWQPDSGPW